MTPKGYWAVHAKADMKQQILIPQCDPDSPSGKLYTRTVWGTATRWNQEPEVWSNVPVEQKLNYLYQES